MIFSIRVSKVIRDVGAQGLDEGGRDPAMSECRGERVYSSFRIE